MEDWKKGIIERKSKERSGEILKGMIGKMRKKKNDRKKGINGKMQKRIT